MKEEKYCKTCWYNIWAVCEHPEIQKYLECVEEAYFRPMLINDEFYCKFWRDTNER